jgi:Family of unknown function (DUF6328)
MTGCQETPDQRLARNLGELLQEIRVAQAGVQILFGFLFSITFTEAYRHASGFQRGVHLVAVAFAVLAVAQLTAPAAWHRLLFRRGQRQEIIRLSNVMAISGLGCLAAAMSATLLLLMDVATGRTIAVVVCAVVTVGFGALWFVLPWRIRQVGNENARDDAR